MTVKELIKHLSSFDGEHTVQIDVDAECGHLKVLCEIDDIQFKQGECRLVGYAD